MWMWVSIESVRKRKENPLNLITLKNFRYFPQCVFEGDDMHAFTSLAVWISIPSLLENKKWRSIQIVCVSCVCTHGLIFNYSTADAKSKFLCVWRMERRMFSSFLFSPFTGGKDDRWKNMPSKFNIQNASLSMDVFLAWKDSIEALKERVGFILTRGKGIL